METTLHTQIDDKDTVSFPMVTTHLLPCIWDI